LEQEQGFPAKETLNGQSTETSSDIWVSVLLADRRRNSAMTGRRQRQLQQQQVPQGRPHVIRQQGTRTIRRILVSVGIAAAVSLLVRTSNQQSGLLRDMSMKSSTNRTVTHSSGATVAGGTSGSSTNQGDAATTNDLQRNKLEGDAKNALEQSESETSKSQRKKERRRRRRSSRSTQVQWTSINDIPDTTDFYAASWIMNTEMFRQVDTTPDSIRELEDGVFAAFHRRDHQLRMTLDFLDFGVEHLSHWWRRIGVPNNDAGYRFFASTLSSYMEKHAHQQQEPFPVVLERMGDDSARALHPTVAVVAFSQIQFDAEPTNARLSASELAARDRNVSLLSLGATLASLVRVGMGRIVVVGSDPNDELVVRETFRLLQAPNVSSEESADSRSPFVRQIHDTHLSFALVPQHMVNSTGLSNNVPRGTLAGLQLAFEGTDAHWTQHWLGMNASYWKYVYYSEADTLLQTRPSVMRHIQQKLDDGLVVAPHRLQLIAYEGDVPDFHLQSKSRLVPTDFKTPLVINSGEVMVDAEDEDEVDEDTNNANDGPYQYCCDALEFNYRPGRTDYPPCGDFWYRCGWSNGGNHSRLEPYRFMQLSDGTGITTLSATEHARRCHPSRVPCQYSSGMGGTQGAGAEEAQQ
jgi:hypothetical protein